MKNSKYEEQKKNKLVSKIPSYRVILQANDGVEDAGTASGPRTAVHFLFCAEQKKQTNKKKQNSIIVHTDFRLV